MTDNSPPFTQPSSWSAPLSNGPAPSTHPSLARRPVVMPLTRQRAMFNVCADRSIAPSPLQFHTTNTQPPASQDSRIYAPVARRHNIDHLNQDLFCVPHTQTIPGHQPFLGLQSLSTGSLSTTNANHAHRSSASSTLVQRPSRRGGVSVRGQGPLGTRAPAASRRTQSARVIDPAELCLVGENGIRLQVRVYPPDVCFTFLYLLDSVANQHKSPLMSWTGSLATVSFRRQWLDI